MITLAEQVAEAQRELALRRKCYPQWIKCGKLDEGEAKYQIRVMQAIVHTLTEMEELVHTLEQIEAKQRLLSLFGTRAD
jgi:hypothetical protein